MLLSILASLAEAAEYETDIEVSQGVSFYTYDEATVAQTSLDERSVLRMENGWNPIKELLRVL